MAGPVEVLPSSLRQGNRAFIDPGEVGGPWHEYLCLRRVGPPFPGGRSDGWLTFTPDGDLYNEALTCPFHVNIRFGDGLTPSAGLGIRHGVPVYRFPPDSLPRGQDLASIVEQAEAELSRLRSAEPAFYNVAGLPVVAASVDVPMPPSSSSLLLCTDVRGVITKLGEEVSLAEVLRAGVNLGIRALFLRDGETVCLDLVPVDRVLTLVAAVREAAGALTPSPVGVCLADVTPGGDLYEDPCTLPFARNALGERYRWVRSCVENPPSSFDERWPCWLTWPLKVPRTSFGYVEEISNTGHDVTPRHQSWKHENRLDLSQAIGCRGCIVHPELLRWVSTKAAEESKILKEQKLAEKEGALSRAPTAE
jgi:hypothetical protein